MPFLKRFRLPIAALLTMAAVSLWAWPRLPERLAVHWNLAGEPDRYGGRVEALLLLPLILLGVTLLLGLLPRFDRNGERNAAILAVARNAVAVGLAALHLALVALHLGWPLDILRAAALVVGGVLLATGNLLPKAQPSLFVGVRLPWTLTSKRSWYRSQRLGGWVLSLTGGVFIVAAIVGTGPLTLLLPLGFLALGLLVVAVDSYLVWRADDDRESAL